MTIVAAVPKRALLGLVSGMLWSCIVTSYRVPVFRVVPPWAVTCLTTTVLTMSSGWSSGKGVRFQIVRLRVQTPS